MKKLYIISLLLVCANINASDEYTIYIEEALHNIAINKIQNHDLATVIHCLISANVENKDLLIQALNALSKKKDDLNSSKKNNELNLTKAKKEIKNKLQYIKSRKEYLRRHKALLDIKKAQKTSPLV